MKRFIRMRTNHDSLLWGQCQDAHRLLPTAFYLLTLRALYGLTFKHFTNMKTSYLVFSTPSIRLNLIIAALTLAAWNPARASISYAIAGSTYSENFDSLPTDAPNNANLQGTGAG